MRPIADKGISVAIRSSLNDRLKFAICKIFRRAEDLLTISHFPLFVSFGSD